DRGRAARRRPGPRAGPGRDRGVPGRDVEPGRRPVPAEPRHRVLGGQGAAPRRKDGVKATRVSTTADRVMGIETTAGTLATDALVVAAGVWTPDLTRTVGIDVPIMPVVMSELETKPVPPLFKATLRGFGFGARQRPGGQLVVSAGLNARVWHSVSLADLHGP